MKTMIQLTAKAIAIILLIIYALELSYDKEMIWTAIVLLVISLILDIKKK